jgi:hypothetical protein
VLLWWCITGGHFFAHFHRTPCRRCDMHDVQSWTELAASWPFDSKCTAHGLVSAMHGWCPSFHQSTVSHNAAHAHVTCIQVSPRVMMMLGVCVRRGRPRHPYRV